MDELFKVRIVTVISSRLAIDDDGKPHRIERTDGLVPLPGHYVVIWFVHTGSPCLDDTAQFHGPYPLQLLARLNAGHHVSEHLHRERNRFRRRHQQSDRASGAGPAQEDRVSPGSRR